MRCLAPSAAAAHVWQMTQLAHLPDRAALAVSGEDRVSFLQGLVSNDVTGAVPGHAVFAALLTPQGKWLADFLIVADADRLLLDCERALAPMLAQRLTRYRLRAKVAIEATELQVHAAWDGAPDTPGIIARDPRLEAAGWRVLAATPLATNASAEEWDAHRLALGLPDGSRDCESDKTILLEAGFDELAGVSWTKGCYMGQELTARTKYRGLLKRRLVPVLIEGAPPPPGTPITSDGAEVGTLRSGQGPRAIAQLRIDALDRVLTCGGARLRADIPAWMKLPTEA